MPGHQAPPALLKGFNVDTVLEAMMELFNIDSRIRIEKGVKEHSLLHWRERINILEIRVVGEESLQLRVVKI